MFCNVCGIRVPCVSHILKPHRRDVRCFITDHVGVRQSETGLKLCKLYPMTHREHCINKNFWNASNSHCAWFYGGYGPLPDLWGRSSHTVRSSSQMATKVWLPILVWSNWVRKHVYIWYKLSVWWTLGYWVHVVVICMLDGRLRPHVKKP